MLIEFSVENYKSFKDKATLSMVATKDKSNDKNLIEDKDLKGITLLKEAVLYGSNASGKTNLLDALNYMSFLVNQSHLFKEGEATERTAFKLDSECINKPSIFDISFLHKGIRYDYGFSVNENKILSEYMHYYKPESKTKKHSVIFERYSTDDGETKYEFKTDKSFLEPIKLMTKDNTLFFSFATMCNYEKTKAPFEWFSNKLLILLTQEIQHNMGVETVRESHKDKKFKNLVNKYLKMIDFGPTDFITKIKEKEIIFDGKPIKRKVYDAMFEHPVYDTKGLKIASTFFRRDEESQGTFKFFCLLGPFLKAIEYGNIICIDELDVKLHTHLSEILIKLFNDPKINTKNAQLIFTTHDVNLLKQSIFRRDQIWFTEKDNKGASSLYSLDEFSERTTTNLQKAYLQGRYGAIPYINEGMLMCQD